jgi:uncharacterized protein (TIGR02453 family)
MHKKTPQTIAIQMPTAKGCKFDAARPNSMSKYPALPFFEFFIGLAADNRKGWFDTNREAYEREVKAPFHQLVAAMQAALGAPYDQMKTGELIFRINKDIRFSKDKSPYKLHMAAAFAPGGKKDMMNPGFYFQLGAEQCVVYMGVYNPDTALADRIRRYIANHPEKLETLVASPAFRNTFGAIQGDEQKRVAGDLKELAAAHPLIARKQWYFGHSFEPETIVENDPVAYLMKVYMTGIAVNDYLAAAIHS